MRKKLLTLASITLIFINTNIGKADELTAEKYVAIETLFEVSNTNQIGTTMMNQFIPLVLNAYKDKIPKKASNIIKDEMEKFFHDELVVRKSLNLRLQPVYHQNFTLDEINQLIKFYKSPAAKKAMSPSFLQESMKIGSEWGKSLGKPMMERVSKRLENEGITMSQ